MQLLEPLRCWACPVVLAAGAQMLFEPLQTALEVFNRLRRPVLRFGSVRQRHGVENELYFVQLDSRTGDAR